MEHFLPDGQLLSKTPYKNDLKNGIAYYYSKGILLGEENYKDGKLISKKLYKDEKLLKN